jgi:Ig-like domain from next to BRCA1 gene
MDAPKQVGRYDAFFRMATPDDKLFGHKVWCDIMTIEPEKKPEVQQVVVPVEPIVIE